MNSADGHGKRTEDAPAPAEGAFADYVSEVLHEGPLYRKLFSLRREHPEIAHELDEIAQAVRQVTDRIEAYVRDHYEGAPEAPSPRR